jgi:hypothetical protein
MKSKIKVLYYNLDGAGVNHYRSLTPAMEIDRNHSDDFDIEINPQIDFKNPNTIDYLKTFDIIHYHRQLVDDINLMLKISTELKKVGTVLVNDIDDYWYLNKNHPFYGMSIENKTHIPIINNLKIANYCTTTTELFANEIKKVTGKDNVEVLYNAIDPTWMKQFQNNWKPDENGRVRITYMAGSSHLGDVAQLEGVMNILSNDSDLKDKFKIIISGWDTEGSTQDINFNLEFGKVLEAKGMWNKAVIKIINTTRGDIDKIPGLSDEIRDKYRGKIFDIKQRTINSTESVYYVYENILTDNHKMIKNQDYLKWLNNFERNVKYDNEGNFARRWTEKANAYAKVLDETDIVIAPLDDNVFNTMKSNLKQVECWSRKLPIVCSDIAPYNVDGRHMENCILIPAKKNAAKYWAKYLNKLILDADLRKKLGEQLYEDFNVKYNLISVTEKRVAFYKEILDKSENRINYYSKIEEKVDEIV